MKRLQYLMISLVLAFFNYSFGQYEMSLQNDVQSGPDTYDFEVYIKSTLGTINLTSYQIVLSFNTSIANGGNLSFSYIGSSQLTNLPNQAVDIKDDGATKNLVAGSLQGSDNITTSDVKVGKFRISNTNTFANIPATIDWDFVNTIVTEVNINSNSATIQANHKNFMNNLPLPVELSSFTALIKENKVNLKWQTTTEINNYGFEIERKVGSVELGDWEKIGFVEGYGNSNSLRDYSYSDNYPVGGTRFIYRLKQIDNSGKFEYSDEVEIELVPDKFTLYQNYPNPFNPVTNIKFALPRASRVSLIVYNTLGEKVATLLNEVKEAGFFDVKFDANDLSSGVYIFRLTTDDFIQTKKMNLIK